MPITRKEFQMAVTLKDALEVRNTLYSKLAVYERILLHLEEFTSGDVEEPGIIETEDSGEVPESVIIEVMGEIEKNKVEIDKAIHKLETMEIQDAEDKEDKAEDEKQAEDSSSEEGEDKKSGGDGKKDREGSSTASGAGGGRRKTKGIQLQSLNAFMEALGFYMIMHNGKQCFKSHDNKSMKIVSMNTAILMHNMPIFDYDQEPSLFYKKVNPMFWMKFDGRVYAIDNTGALPRKFIGKFHSYAMNKAQAAKIVKKVKFKPNSSFLSIF